MKIRAFDIPYDSGLFDQRMGSGPGELLQSGLIHRLRFLGHQINIEHIRLDDAHPTEIRSAFTLANQLAIRIEKAYASQETAIVMSGNCNTALGTISGLGASRTGVLWFDAHGEFNTPETTTSGFLDGMALAMATGQCWKRMADSIYNYNRVPSQNIALVGVIDTDPAEQVLLDNSGIQQIPGQQIREKGVRALLAPVVAAFKRRVECLYVHFDLDVLDNSEASWNQWTPRKGLRITDILEALDMLAGGPPVAAIGLASYDPRLDAQRSSEAARRIVDAVLAVAGA